MFIAAQFTKAKRWKKPRRPPTDEWIIKCGVFTYDGILFILKKGKEIPSHVTMWMNLEDILLSEISQT